MVSLTAVPLVRPTPTHEHIPAAYIFLCKHISFFIIDFWYMEIHHQILTRKARPKKTRTTRIHFTTPVSWISAFSMHSLLIYGGSILRASFFFECKEVDVASSHLVSCLASILVGVSTSALISSDSRTKDLVGFFLLLPTRGTSSIQVVS